MTSITRLDDTFLTCRALRHAWEVYRFSAVLLDEADDRWSARVRARYHGTPIKRSLMCLRCGTERVDVYVRRDARQRNLGALLPFERVSSHYRYPDGYNLEGHRPAFIEYAQEQFRRGT